MEPGKTKKLALADIRTNGGTQTRERIDSETVDSYADAMKGGAVFPEPIVFFDGAAYWLADGFHRVAAWLANGELRAKCDVRQGDRRAAILFSVGANAQHGLRRTNADKHRAVTLLLGDDEWAGKSDRWIAQKCGVAPSFVGTVRGQLSTENSCSASNDASPLPRSPPRMGQDGKVRSLPAPPAGKVAAAASESERSVTPAEPIASPLRLVGQAARPWSEEDALADVWDALKGFTRLWEEKAESFDRLQDAAAFWAAGLLQEEAARHGSHGT